MRPKGASLEAIERIYRTKASGFLRLALATTGNVERARDALQEGFAGAIRSRNTFRGTGSIEAWLARCVLNAARDSYSPADSNGDVSSTEGNFELSSDGARAVVREAIMQLPRRQREAVFLRYYLDLDYRAISEALGMERGTVSATLHAARAALAEVLQEVER
ncbi:MAG: sigma-70 family RNA polymerase sigma factor [Gaiellaceae bacterium]|jgi:RNA polymerase sigma factor (sigma-70 family)